MKIHATAIACFLTILLSPGVPCAAPPDPGEALSVLRRYAGTGAYRALALERLARHGDREAAATLQREAASGAPPDRHAAGLALVRLGDAAAARDAAAQLPGTPDAADTIEALVTARAAAAVPALVRTLGSPDTEVRATAALALGHLGLANAEAAAALRRVLDDCWGTVRAAAAAGLWRLGDRSVGPILETLLTTPLPEIQLAAADAWAPETAGPWVAETEPLLRSPTAERRHAAARRLGTVRRTQVTAMLRADLEPNMPADVRISAARLAEGRVTAEDQPWLEPLLGDPEPEVQIRAAGAILEASRP